MFRQWLCIGLLVLTGTPLCGQDDKAIRREREEKVSAQRVALVIGNGQYKHIDTLNGWGVHDMHGNVWEWVEDCVNDSYVGAPADGSAWESGDCGKRVLRGGSWFDEPRNLRSANRNWYSTDFRINLNGFRVIRRF